MTAIACALSVGLAAIHTQADHERAVEFMNQLLDVVGDDEEHELADILELLGQLIEDHESQHCALPNGEPAQVLRFLMEQHGLKQADLASGLGTQSAVRNQSLETTHLPVELSGPGSDRQGRL